MPDRGIVVCLAAALVVATGCALLSPLVTTNWSENYALDANGGVANVPELNDGKTTTVANTHPKSDPREFVIEFPEPKQVRRIRIANQNLYRFSISYWDEARSEWRVLRTVWQRRDVDSYERSIQPVFDFTHINLSTTKIKITVTRTVEDRIVNKVAPVPGDKIIEHVQRTIAGTWVEFWRVIVESPARVREVEVYGVLPKRDTGS
jgi:hypothetical protein